MRRISKQVTSRGPERENFTLMMLQGRVRGREGRESCHVSRPVEGERTTRSSPVALLNPPRAAPHTAMLHRSSVVLLPATPLAVTVYSGQEAGLWSPCLAHTDSGHLHRSPVTYDRHAARTAARAILVNVFWAPAYPPYKPRGNGLWGSLRGKCTSPAPRRQGLGYGRHREAHKSEFRVMECDVVMPGW